MWPIFMAIAAHFLAKDSSDVGRRILLLYGPPSSGKSQLVILLKRGLEAYTQTEEGAVYAIADCPQHEDPLNLTNPATTSFTPVRHSPNWIFARQNFLLRGAIHGSKCYHVLHRVVV